jgi:uncharacterized membrane protein
MSARPLEEIAMQDSSIDAAASPAAAPRHVAAERGLAWWTEAWALFMRNPLMWVALGLIVFVGLMVVGMVPLLGGVAISLLMPALTGGWMLAARKLEQGGSLEVADLFLGLRGDHAAPLLVLGAVLTAAMVAIGVVAGVLGLGAVFGLAMGGVRHSAGGVMAALGAGFAALAVALVLGAVVTTALWFAPALVVLRRTPPLQALQLSFAATMANMLAFLVFGLVAVVATIVASIPFGLGWIVLLPVSLLTAYVSYRELFEA